MLSRRIRRRSRATSGPDLTTTIGALRIPNPLMTAAGTAGYGTELAAHLDLSALGAHVVKSLSAESWAGNPAPRVSEVAAGMLNSVGLQNPGIRHWLTHELPQLEALGVTRTVASIWGFRIDDFTAAAELISAHANRLLAIEINVSCPNLDGGRHLFAHDPATAAAVIDTVRSAVPRSTALWAKLSPNTDRLVNVAGAVLEAGADALTLVNTVQGMAIDPVRRKPLLGAGSGGLSGPAIRPVAVRAIYECRRAYPDAAIVGVGGVARGVDAAELICAGADAVQVGTATFFAPGAAARVLRELEHWCSVHGIRRIQELRGSSHD